MENNRKEYSENDSQDVDKTAAEYGNEPANQQSDMTGNETFGDSSDFKNNETTGSGLSESERNAQDGRNSPETNQGNGSEELIEKYNINDKAHNDSSSADFVETTSNWQHASEDDFNEEDEPDENASIH